MSDPVPLEATGGYDTDFPGNWIKPNHLFSLAFYKTLERKTSMNFAVGMKLIAATLTSRLGFDFLLLQMSCLK